MAKPVWEDGGRVWMLGYSAMLGLGLLVSAPWWLARMATTRRYREGLAERLGRVPRRLRAAVAGKRVVWVHAVSVGEVLAISRLVAELESALNGRDPTEKSQRSWTAVISTTTRTGQALARERFGEARVFYFPLDFALAVRAFLRVLRPALVVLAESELWPRLLAECRRRGVPVAVVNARVSDRSFRRAVRVCTVWAPVLRQVTLWLAQSEEDARRLVAMGVSGENVRVCGNLKYDVRPPQPSPVAALLREALDNRPVIVAGSTVAGEDALVLAAFDAIWSAFPRSFLVIAPRHPERFGTVLTLAEEWGAVRATSLTKENFRTILRQDREADDRGMGLESNTLAVVLDTIGDLAAVYAMADIAFVGGSMVRSGGHNPLEPAQFGVPVVLGPSFENFRDVVNDLRAADAIEILEGSAMDAKTIDFETVFDLDRPHPLRDQLAAACIRLLKGKDEADAMGRRGQKVFLSQGGGTARTTEALLPLLHRPTGNAHHLAVPA